MGMSTNAYAVKPPDERWQRMKAAYDACKAAGVEVPDEVDGFFGGEPPDPAGVVEHLGVLARKWHGDCADGLEVDLDRVPPGTKTIRFANSW
jgi:hypothetical protein